MVSWPNHRCGYILRSLQFELCLKSIRNRLIFIENLIEWSLRKPFLCLIQFSTFSFEQFKPWTSVLFGTFYLWRVSSDLIMTAVRSKRTFIEYRLFEQYKFSIDSITNKTFWISKLFSEIICNENFIPVTLLLHPQAVCLGNNVFNKPHDMQRELSHIKSSLIMSNHRKLMSYDLLPHITDFIS